MFDKPVKMRYNRLKKREREVNSMKYTVKMKNKGRDWGTPIETDDLREALRIKRQNNVRYVGIITTIIDNDTNKEVVTKNNYYGETRVYGLHIKMY